jgi:hypothetical protein
MHEVELGNETRKGDFPQRRHMPPDQNGRKHAVSDADDSRTLHAERRYEDARLDMNAGRADRALICLPSRHLRDATSARRSDTSRPLETDPRPDLRPAQDRSARPIHQIFRLRSCTRLNGATAYPLPARSSPIALLRRGRPLLGRDPSTPPSGRTQTAARPGSGTGGVRRT